MWKLSKVNILKGKHERLLELTSDQSVPSYTYLLQFIIIHPGLHPSYKHPLMDLLLQNCIYQTVL